MTPFFMADKGHESNSTWKDFILICMYGPLLVIQVVCVFMFFNYPGYNLLMVLGIVMLLSFFVVGYLPSYEFKKRGGVPEGKSYMHTTTVVDTGIYAYVRHPQFLSWILLSIGLACLSQYWLSVVCVILIAVLIYMEALRADTTAVEKFGDSYRQYMQKVPRLNPLVGLYRVFSQK